jgi:chitodextrinase
VLEATVPADTQAPSVPTGLAATGVSTTEVSLSWNASTDNVGVAGYRVYRDGGLVKTTATTSATDTGLTALTSYSYTVAAFDYAGNPSAQSAPLVVTTAATAPSFVQQTYAVPQTPQASVGAVFAAAQTAGDTNIVAIGWNDTVASIVSVTDSAGNTYHQGVATSRGSGLSQAIYYASNVLAASANQVTVTFDQAAVFVDLRVAEYAGIRQTNPVTAGVSAWGSGTLANSGSLVTSAPSELLFAAGMTSAVFTGPGTGYMSRVITSPDGDIVEDAIAVSTGSHNATAPLGSGTWLLQLAAFAAAP